jgi:Fe-S-cluster-containing hydrogenase component 2
MQELMFVRCDGCAEAACALECGQGAIIEVAGDILVDRAKCVPCDTRRTEEAGGGLPRCIALCDKAGVKSLRSDSLSEKRTKTVEKIY